ncbi:methyltransferase [Buchnera aphidicola]|uniref:methyltransferase n=1 Tax=Buchnera aphidicola TaxID=9 RepID=UPI0039C93826
MDAAKHAILFYGTLNENSYFQLKNYFNNHIIQNCKIKTLPSVFGHKKIDPGSKLLISTFTNKIKGNILDLGTGSGIISILLADISNKINLTLTDINLISLFLCKINLFHHRIKGNILPSNLYSNINKQFDVIICNPPIHRDLKMSLKTIINMIQQSANYLKTKGELRFVTNRFLSFDRILNDTFNKYTILKRNNHFKVYQAII